MMIRARFEINNFCSKCQEINILYKYIAIATLSGTGTT